jgi:hypothetical protein
LVCKAWQKAEREFPHQPVQLQLRPEDFNPTFMTWHLRDTSRLEEVEMLGNRHQIIASEDYRKWMLQLLNHLSDKAPALRSLGIVPPRATKFVFEIHEHPFHFLPLVCAMSRLESLAIREWEYSPEDIPLISHLTMLQNLKVPQSPLCNLVSALSCHRVACNSSFCDHGSNN